jgi:WD40 repeat protein
MRILHGHTKSVLSLDMGDAWILSGSADEEVRFWKMGKHGKYSITAQTVHILVGHEAPVTCVRYGRLEVMSGDSLGKIDICIYVQVFMFMCICIYMYL